ncbi:MAG: DNA repair protein RecO [Luteibaculum sp.]
MHKSKAFILRCQAQGDSSLIFHAICEDESLRSFILKGGQKRKKGSVGILKSPLAKVELVYYPSKSGGIHMLKSFNALRVDDWMDSDIVKLNIRMFIAEIVWKYAVVQPSDSEAFELVNNISKEISNSAEPGLIPLEFVLMLCKALGLSPSVEEKDNLPHSLHPGLELFQRWIKTSTQQIIESERIPVLDFLLGYLAFHHANFTQIKSLKIIREVLRAE